MAILFDMLHPSLMDSRAVEAKDRYSIYIRSLPSSRIPTYSVPGRNKQYAMCTTLLSTQSSLDACSAYVFISRQGLPFGSCWLGIVVRTGKCGL